MTDLIHDLAQVDMPTELLNQLDMRNILTNFRSNFNKLDDLKKFTNEYEKKNFLARWWHNDKLKDAQLNAQEVQAEFSKSIGQLMVISMLQSQRLEKQQRLLSEQQTELKKQSNNISAHTDDLGKQQQKLAETSRNQEELLNNFLDLQGFTADNAKKLIDIASDVKNTKTNLIRSFDEKMLETQKRSNELEQQIGGLKDLLLQQNETFNANFIEHVSRVASRCDGLDNELRERHEQFKSKQSSELLEQREALVTQIQFVQNDVAKNEQESKRGLDELTQSIARIDDEFSNRHATTEETIKQLEQKLEQTTQNFDARQANGMNQLKNLKILVAVLGVGFVVALGYVYHIATISTH